MHPNAFSFKVKFNPSNGEKQPFIDKKLENIKTIKLQRIILPNYYKLEKISVDKTSTTFDTDIITILNNSLTPSTDTEFNASSTPAITAANKLVVIWYKQTGTNLTLDFFDVNDTLKHEKVYSAVVDVTNGAGALVLADVTTLDYYTYKPSNPIKISDDRFINMEIDEFKNIDEYSTDVYHGQSFGTLYHDSRQCNDNVCYMESLFSEINFPNSNLKNISTLTIKLLSSVGEELDTSTNKNTEVDNKTKLNEYNGTSIKYVSASRYIRHPLYIHNQCHFIFKIEYLEPSINKVNFN